MKIYSHLAIKYTRTGAKFSNISGWQVLPCGHLRFTVLSPDEMVQSYSVNMPGIFRICLPNFYVFAKFLLHFAKSIKNKKKSTMLTATIL